MQSRDPLSLTSTRWRFLSTGCLGSVLLLVSASAGAGQLATLEPGSRVRITAPIYGIEDAVGTVEDTPAGALIVGFESLPPPQGATAWTLRTTNITDLDVSVDQRRYGFKGFGIGFVSGILIGAAAGLLAGRGQDDDFESDYKVVPLAGAFALAGAAAGLVIGSMRRDDVWVPAGAIILAKANTSPTVSANSAGPPLLGGAPRVDVGFAIHF